VLEPLSGRLKWERKNNGIRVVIPARICASTLRKTFIDMLPGLSGAAFGLALVLVFDRRHPFRWHDLYILISSWLLTLGAAMIVKLCTTRTTLTFDKNLLEIKYSDLGIRRGDPRKYSTNQIYDLRFVEFTPEADIRNDLRLDEMQFDRKWLTHAFGAGIGEDEASALIARMMEVYPIPKSPPKE